MFDDDDIEDEIRDLCDDDTLGLLDCVNLLEDDDDDYNTEAGDYPSMFEVACRNGCGVFPMDEVNMINFNEAAMTVKFRCPVCNDVQTSSLLIED